MKPPPQSIGEYQILEELGRGGMGVVYMARQKSLGRTVALKVLRTDTAQDEGVRRRMKREMNLMRGLSHPNLVRLLDGDVDHEPPYIVFEHLAGCTDLMRLLLRGTLEGEKAREMLVEMALGLEYLHSQGIIHRDLKPGNVLVDGDGRPRIIDFGLSRDVSGTHTVLTQDGQTFGSIQYMAPEQMESAAVDQRADVYSFGLIAYEMLVGRMMFAGLQGAPISLSGRLRGEFPPLWKVATDLDPVWERAVTRCMEIDPGKRTASLTDFLREVQVEAAEATLDGVVPPELVSGPGDPAAPTRAPETVARPARSGRGLAAVGVILVTGIVLGGFGERPGAPGAPASSAPAGTVASTTIEPSREPGLSRLVGLAAALSASPTGTLQQLKTATKAKKLEPLLEKWGIEELARDPIMAVAPPALSPGVDLERSTALLRLDYLDVFCRVHRLPPLFGTTIEERLPPGLRRRPFPEEEGWEFRAFPPVANVKEGKPLSMTFEVEDPASLVEVVVLASGLNLFPEFICWFRLNESSSFALYTDKQAPFSPGGAGEDEDRRELGRALERAPFLHWRDIADMNKPEENTEAVGLLCRGVPPSFFRTGSNQLDIHIFEVEGPRHFDGPTLWRLGLGLRRRSNRAQRNDP